MSHTTTVKSVDVTNINALKLAAATVGAECSQSASEHRMFDGTLVTGYAVKFKTWNYPVVFDGAGKAHYDNYGETWGKQDCLDHLLQNYAATVTREQAEMLGYTVDQTVDEKGDMVQTITSY